MASNDFKKRRPKRKFGSSQRPPSSWPDTDQLRAIAQGGFRLGQVQLNVNNILHLQRLVGNRAVANLISKRAKGVPTIQRADELAGASLTTLISELESMKKRYYKAKRKPKLSIPKIVEDFKKSGKLKIITFSASVFSERKFFSRKLAHLKRGHRISVLGLKSGWCRVKTDDGKLGWMHYSHVIPSVALGELSSKPRRNIGGATRDEIVIGGRG
ncbi:MAG: hypothetical protein BMS9Abin02_1874 [Anaerolineae bacterium]|nr:MAG: hypothetical protein BMS9Abin02_1874 [Anaerolineae bacterium]